jgi:hypothetical protein
MRRLAAGGPTVTSAEARSIAIECAAGRGTADDAVRVLGGLEDLGLVIPLQHDLVTGLLEVLCGSETGHPGTDDSGSSRHSTRLSNRC